LAVWSGSVGNGSDGARLVVHTGAPDRVATILPGRGYSPDFPVLYYTRALLLAWDWTVHELRWGALPADPARWPEHVRQEAAGVLGRRNPEAIGLVVGKSLGTHALPLAVEHGLAGIWLTPLLSDQDQVEALQRAGAPTLVVGGTADPYGDHGFATELASRWSPAAQGQGVVELPGADHSLEVPGDPQASVEVLGKLTDTIARFLDLVADPTR
jgi:pimeloyl-ACP methyl ester carboxylesterase